MSSQKRRVASMLLAALLLSAPRVAHGQTAPDSAVRLLQILRDRGSITAEDYDELLLAVAAERRAPETPVTLPALEARVMAQEAVVASSAAQLATVTAMATATQEAAETARRALSNKWYEKIGLRGYTQFRIAEVFADDGVPLEVPADRSVAPNESLMIRRGRFIFSGDISDRLALYAQFDFNGSTGAADFSLQMRDLYADIALDDAKTFRVRLGQSKVPFGFVNLQSSQNRAALERADALNSAVEGERDLGAYLMWAPAHARQMFRDLVSRGLKGSGDYGVIAVGAFGGQGLNRPDQDGAVHWTGRVSYPFVITGSQIVEFGVQGYTGHFVVSTQSIDVNGVAITPTRPNDGHNDRRVAATAIWYPQPIGFEAEWNIGTGPELADDSLSIQTRPLQGGYLQLHYRHTGAFGTWLPFTRWQYYDGGRKFARNAPHTRVNEIDVGLEFAKWAEVEVTTVYTRTLERGRTSASPYVPTRNRNRIGVQVQWNY